MIRWFVCQENIFLNPSVWISLNSGIQYEFASDAEKEHTCNDGYWSADNLGKHKPLDLVSHSCL